MTFAFSLSEKVRAGGLLALALAFGIASFGSSASAAGSLAAAEAAAALDAKSSGMIVLAKNDGKGRHNWNGNKGHKNWSKNDKGWNGDKNWNKKGGQKFGKGHHHGNWNRGYVRKWERRPHYGELIGGIVLGSLFAANGFGVPPAAYPPAPGLCWYWADPLMYRGYWDYCD